MRDGQKLPSELRLAEMFQVSRATVREALRSLAESGLISTTPGANGGSFVTFFDHHRLAELVSARLTSTLEVGSITFEEVTAFRGLLEAPAARLAAQNRTDEHVARLRESVERAKQLHVNSRETYKLNDGFHRIVADAAGNRLLATFVEALLTVMEPVDRSITPVEGTDSDVRSAHHEIAEAIAAGDADEAERLTRAHLDALQEYANRPR
jgi:DNA-binding FadR family transcriptional regulator